MFKWRPEFLVCSNVYEGWQPLTLEQVAFYSAFWCAPFKNIIKAPLLPGEIGLNTELTVHKSLKLFTAQDNVNVISLDSWNNTFSKLDALSNYSDHSWNPAIFFLPFSPSGVSHFIYQKALRKAAVMVDWETMMLAAFPAHPMPCPSATLRRSTLIMLHPTTALKGMATLILNPVSDTSLVLQYGWAYCVCKSTTCGHNNIGELIMLVSSNIFKRKNAELDGKHTCSSL